MITTREKSMRRVIVPLAVFFISAWTAGCGVEQSGEQSALVQQSQEATQCAVVLTGPEYMQTQCFSPTTDPFSPGSPSVDPDPFVDPGATVEAPCSGEGTPSIVSFNNILKQLPGVYVIEYYTEEGTSNGADPVTRTVEVIDTLAPKLKVNPPIALSPVDNTLRTVNISACVIAWDQCDGYMDVNAHLYDLVITSNEPGNDTGDSNIINSSLFQVRARLNADGSERRYFVTFKVADNSGNEQQGQCTVYVPVTP
jgi:large repetitive protein